MNKGYSYTTKSNIKIMGLVIIGNVLIAKNIKTIRKCLKVALTKSPSPIGEGLGCGCPTRSSRYRCAYRDKLLDLTKTPVNKKPPTFC